MGLNQETRAYTYISETKELFFLKFIPYTNVFFLFVLALKYVQMLDHPNLKLQFVSY